ncbi:MAG: UDP-glucose 4-epimerase [uncultured Solirubrobacteraceae bacterium]|uniref:UDP-glucose 4-epimerase n=1 Tax=uncultured Solirubrobacteraceae bacterium TaxID=1162706 RepID=A0A6J4SRW4_9ACTN|nr:MAG: UDP-glucose 4-epimerase [uncultured Solirubrobacteraceae bacterium]
MGEQLLVLVGAQAPRGEAGGVQRGPEPVARPGEVVARLGGPQRRVDPDEEGPEPGTYDVAERLGARRPTTST